MATATSEPRYFIDSGILMRHFRQQEPTILDAALNLYGLGMVSVLVFYEVEVGGALAGRSREFATKFPFLRVVELSPPIATLAAQLHATLLRQNQGIGLPDLLIAATALHFELPMLTLNRRHFERVPNLALLDIPER